MQGGRGVPKDIEAALQMFQLAGEQGHALSQYNLGVLYQQRGGEQNLVQATHWYKLSAERDHTRAMLALEKLCAGNEAMVWFKRAAGNGDPSAQLEIGHMYAAGIGVQPDVEQAMR